MIDFERLEEELTPNMRGGEGTVKARRFLQGNVKILKLTLEKGVSIGEHRHETDCEAYYVLEGTAHVMLDGVEEVVRAGECHYCPKGSAHSVINLDDEPLVLFAMVA